MTRTVAQTHRLSFNHMPYRKYNIIKTVKNSVLEGIVDGPITGFLILNPKIRNIKPRADTVIEN